MKKRLGDDDASAVDLAFDASSKANKGSGLAAIFGAPVNDAVTKRYTAVDAMLRLLAEMPADEPPPGLARRTCDKIFQRAPLTEQTGDSTQAQA
jgi:hypothetical protein